MKFTCFAITALAATSPFVSAYPGSGDIRFETRAVDFGGIEHSGSVAIAPDGKIVVAGTTDAHGDNDIAVARFSPNGKLDPGFSDDGGVVTSIGLGTNDIATAVVVQPDGKALVTGYTNAKAGRNSTFLVRYNRNGTLDTFFGIDGRIVRTSNQDYRPVAILLQADGKIVVAGTEGIGTGTNSKMAVERYLANGAVDSRWGVAGRAIADFGGMDVCNSAAITSSGQILLAGSTGNGTSFAVARLTPNGVPDEWFNMNGRVTIDFGANARANAVAVQADGRIVVVGTKDGTLPEIAVARCKVSGALDPTFSGDGKTTVALRPASVTESYGRAVEIQKDGKIVIAAQGMHNHCFLVGLQPNGLPDKRFGARGWVNNGGQEFFSSWPAGTINLATAMQRDGKLVVAGFTPGDFSVFRANLFEQSDVRVGTTSSATLGDNVHSNGGAGQTLFTQVRKKGGKKIAYARVQNDGHQTGSLSVRGSSGTSDFSVKYLVGKKDITAAVKSGKYQTGNLVPGASILVKVEITAKTKSARKNRNFFIVARSAEDQSEDTAVIRATSF